MPFKKLPPAEKVELAALLHDLYAVIAMHALLQSNAIGSAQVATRAEEVANQMTQKSKVLQLL